MLEKWFGILPNKILFDKQLSDKEKLLFVLISSLCAEKWYCRANNHYFSECLWINETNCSRYISSLYKKWFIFVDVKKDMWNKRIISLSSAKEQILSKSIPLAENDNTYCWKQQDPLAENSKHNNTSIIDNNNISTKVDTTTSVEVSEKIVYGSKHIAEVIERVKNWCKQYWIIYKADSKETFFGRHLLSKKFEEVLKDIYKDKYMKDISLQKFIDWVLQISTQIKGWYVINNTKTLYQDWVKNIEKWKQQNSKQNTTTQRKSLVIR